MGVAWNCQVNNKKRQFFQECDKIQGQMLAKYMGVCYNKKNICIFTKYSAGKSEKGHAPLLVATQPTKKLYPKAGKRKEKATQ